MIFSPLKTLGLKMNQSNRLEDIEDEEEFNDAMWKVESCGQAVKILGKNMPICPACYAEPNEMGFIQHKHPDIYRNN
jgi:hypothetical protein